MGLAHVYRKPGTSFQGDSAAMPSIKAMNAAGEMVQVVPQKQYYKTQSGEFYEMTEFNQGPTIDWS